jgi:hypothetical protein
MMLAGLFWLGAGGLLIFLGYDASSCEGVTFGGQFLFCSGTPSALETSTGLPGPMIGGALMFAGVLLIFVGLTRLAGKSGIR